MSIQTSYSVLLQKFNDLESTTNALILEAQKNTEIIIFQENVIQEKESTIQEQQKLIEKYQRMLYGQKRERFENVSPIQLGLEFGEIFSKEEIAQLEDRLNKKKTEIKKKEVAKSTTIRPGRKPLPKHLEVIETILTPAGDLSNMVLIGSEISDYLEYVRQSMRVKRVIRLKYAPKDKEGSFLIAPMPSSLFQKCLAAPSLIAQILTDKYVDHLPLDRQLKRFTRTGIDINSSTIDNWVKLGIARLQILYDFVLEQIKKEKYIQADETTIKVLDSEKKGATHLGYYWAYNAPLSNFMVFKYEKGRGSTFPSTVLDDYHGYLQTDAYSGYNEIASREEVTHLACWAHVRRKFEESLTNDSRKATIALQLIQELYAVEREARNGEMSAEKRKSLRLEKSLPIYNDMGKWIGYQMQNTLPRSAIGKAVRYTFNLWDQLGVYLQDGSLEIDNNLIENAIRPIALGRKNYLFAGNHEAAQRAAIVYTFMYLCKKNDVDPYKWLNFVFENIMETSVLKLNDLLPSNIKNNPMF